MTNSDILKPTGELNPKSKYICGIDPARTGKDETAIVVLEQLPFSSNMFIVYIQTLHTPNLSDAINKVIYLNNYFQFAKIIVDETGLGAGVSDVLKSKLGGIVEGIWYTQKSKAELFNNLKLLMLSKDNKIYMPDHIESTNPIIRKMYYQFLSIRQEFKDESSVGKITHEEREHDDIINALALAASYFDVRRNIKRKYTLGGFNAST